MNQTSMSPVTKSDGERARGFRHLTAAQVEAFGRELDAMRERLLQSRGAEDARYIRRLVKIQRSLELAGRGALCLSFFPPAFVLGVLMLAISKIVDNMEIGHNVIHGQYDFMNDPGLRSQTFEWDVVTPADQWRHAHNYIHHTFTNVFGKDRDLGYGVLRMTDEQPWTVWDLFNAPKALLLASLFEVGIAFHDIEFDRLASGEKSWSEVEEPLKGVRKKITSQFLKDYLFFPLLAFWVWPMVLLGNSLANLLRNVWAFVIIFCGHFPEQVEIFHEEDLVGESRGSWYIRQILGSANIEGGKLFHIMSGNLSHQIEHHLFPDIPAFRYAHVAPEVRALCERYGIPYHSGRLGRQFANVVKKIVRLSFPGGREGRALSAVG